MTTFCEKILTIAVFTGLMLGCSETKKAQSPDFDTAKQTQTDSTGDTAGGDTTGGDTTGGDTAGGDTAGGDTAGGDTAGGDTAGGDTTGGDTAGGDTTGGDTVGGDTTGGDTTGSDTTGGDNAGSDNSITEILLNGGFEDGTADHWQTNDGVSSIIASSEQTYSGDYSGKIMGRTANWNAPFQSLLGKLVVGKTYDISAWLRIANAENAQINLSIKITEDNKDNYIGIAQTEASNDKWVQISGKYTYSATNPSDLFVYIEGPDSGIDYYIDDVSVQLDPLSNLTEFSAVTASTLKDIKELPIGVAVPAGSASNSILTSSQRSNIVKQYFNQISAENIMKMDALQPNQNDFTFEAADKLVDFANNNGISVHGHVLLWHSQLPSWMKDFQGDKTEWINMMENHVRQVASHFSGKLVSWDVVNEAFNEDGSYRSAAVDSGHGVDQRQASVWHQNIGNEFIERAFITAREADATAELYYNDYNISWNEAKLDAIVAMAKDFKSRNIPIDGIGFQMHISESGPNGAQLAKQLQKVVDLGLKVKITELDMQMNGSGGVSQLTPYIAERQKQRYFEIVTTYLSIVPKSLRGGITVWGISDSDSWITGLTGNQDWPLLFDGDFNAKPALQGFADALDQTIDPEEPLSNLIINADFEDGKISDWFGHGPTQVTLETSEVHSGTYAAKASGRTDSWNGIAIGANLKPDTTYQLSAWVKLANADTDVASLSIKLTDDDGDHYNSAAYQVAVNQNDWTKLMGTYTHTVTGTDAGHYIYIEGPANNVDFYIDDIAVIEISE